MAELAAPRVTGGDKDRSSMPFRADRRRFLRAGIVVATGSTMAVGYLWSRDDTVSPSGTIKVVRAPSPTPGPSPLDLPSPLPTPVVDFAVEEQLERSSEDDRERSRQRMEERRRVATIAPMTSVAETNAVDIAPELGWRP